jgi:hypothetical protein
VEIDATPDFPIQAEPEPGGWVHFVGLQFATLHHQLSIVDGSALLAWNAASLDTEGFRVRGYRLGGGLFGRRIECTRLR